jgi:hypothetical protein
VILEWQYGNSLGPFFTDYDKTIIFFLRLPPHFSVCPAIGGHTVISQGEKWEFQLNKVVQIAGVGYSILIVPVFLNTIPALTCWKQIKLILKKDLKLYGIYLWPRWPPQCGKINSVRRFDTDQSSGWKLCVHHHRTQ